VSEEEEVKKIVVFGSGSFGTALSFVVAQNRYQVVILTRNSSVAEGINTTHKNPQYIINTNYTLPDNVTAETDPEIALKNVDFIIHTVPVQSSFEFLKNLKPFIPPNVPIISASKGIHSQSLEYMDSIIPRALENPDQPTAFLSGPSFAKELVEKYPTAFVIASKNDELCKAVQKLFLQPCVRVYLNNDVIGVEVGGALKNIFAIAAGIAHGLGLGMNSLAALVTRGCHEMTVLAVKLGSRPQTLNGLSGIGDLMLTCYGSLSRNRSVGVRIGKGEKLEEILESMDEVAEGVATSEAAVRLCEKLGLTQKEVPIIYTVDKTLKGIISARDAVEFLMTLPVDYEIITYS